MAFDVIEEICTEMGVHRDEAYHEYAIFAVTNRGKMGNNASFPAEAKKRYNIYALFNLKY